MAITLDLDPEVEERLRQEAARHGQDAEAYLKTLVEQQVRLRATAPPPQRAIVAGKLSQVDVSERTFNLVLQDGQALHGVLPPGDPSNYASLLNRKVVVDGEVHFDASGGVSTMDATHIHAATDADAIWEHMPRPRPRSLDELRPEILPPPGSNGMEFVFGQWPGDETTEQLLAALKALD